MSTLAARAFTHSNASLKQACTRAFKSSAILSAQKDEAAVKQDQKSKSETKETLKKRKKTMKELDEELRAAMEGRSGDGGISGAELEGGKAVSMKRGVRDNMFRYI